MATIPLYHFRPQGSGSSGVRADTGMFNAERAAAVRVGAAVSDLADPAVKAMQGLQAAKRFKQASELDTGMQEEWDAFQTSLNPSTDETKWAEEWGKKLDARVAKLMPKDAGEATRQELTARVKAFKVRTTGDIGQQAKALGVTKAKTAGLSRTDQLWRNGDAAGAEANLHAMAGLGLILPEDIPGLVQKGASRMEAQQATNLIVNDPIAAADALAEKTPTGRWKNFTKLDEDDRLTLMNHARAQTTAVQAANYQELIDDLNNGTPKTPEALQSLVDRKLLTPRQVKSYTAAYKHGKFTTDPVVVGKLFSDLAAYDPLKDPTKEKQAELLGRIATGGFPQNVQSEANQLLGQKADPNHPFNSPVAKDAFQSIDARFRAGIFGDYQNRRYDVATASWVTDVNPAVYEKAMAIKVRIEDGLRKFLAATPNATAEQVNQVVTGMMQNETARTGRKAILGGLGLSVPAAPAADDDAAAKRARLDAILSRK